MTSTTVTTPPAAAAAPAGGRGVASEDRSRAPAITGGTAAAAARARGSWAAMSGEPTEGGRLFPARPWAAPAPRRPPPLPACPLPRCPSPLALAPGARPGEHAHHGPAGRSERGRAAPAPVRMSLRSRAAPGEARAGPARRAGQAARGQPARRGPARGAGPGPVRRSRRVGAECWHGRPTLLPLVRGHAHRRGAPPRVLRLRAGAVPRPEGRRRGRGARRSRAGCC